MQAKYPKADFGEYFRFLVSRCGTEKKACGTEEHHIAPRAQFPELANEPLNLITLFIADHAFAHKLLRTVHPDFKNNTDAWIASRTDPVRIAAHSERSRKHLKKLHTDAAWAEKRDAISSAIFKKLNADPAFIAARSARMKKQHADPTFAALHSSLKSEHMKKLNADPLFKAASIIRTKARHADPVLAAINIDILKKNQAKANHTRWHINRGIFCSKCKLCLQ